MDPITEATNTPATELVTLDEKGVKALLAEAFKESGLAAVLEKLDALARLNPEAHKAITAAPPARKHSAEEKLDKGQRVAQYIRALAASKRSMAEGFYRDAVTCAKDLYGESHPVTKAIAGARERQKAVESSTGIAGGFAIPDEFSADFIELLRPASVVRQARPAQIRLDRGTMAIPGLAGGATAAYIGEGQNIGKTQPAFRQLRAVSKKIATLVPISNDWLRRADAGADSMIVDDAVSAIGQKSDLAFLRSDGSSGEPKGLKNWAPSGHSFAANATINVTNVGADLGKAILKLRKANSRMIRPAWFMAPRTEEYLVDARDGNANLVWARQMEERSTLRKFPFFSTTQIPDNLGGGSDESEIYLADMADVVIADEETLIVDMSSEAAYADGGNVMAAFSLDQTVLRVIALHDLVVRHAESIAVITGVKWGA